MRTRIFLLLFAAALVLSEMKERRDPSHIWIAKPGVVLAETGRVEAIHNVEHGYEEVGLPESLSDLRSQSGGSGEPQLPNETVPVRPTVDISYVVPCHNEGVWVGEALKNIISLNLNHTIIEVIVVDDSSADDTTSQALAIQDSRVHVTTLAENAGYTGAVIEGISRSLGRYVVVVETRFARRMTTVLPLMHPLETGMAMVLVSRFKDPGASYSLQKKRLWNKLLSFIFSLAYGIHIDDLMPHCVAYQGNLVRRVAKESVKGHFLINTLHYVIRRKLRLSEISARSCGA